MTSPDLSAQLDEAAEREAQRGYEMYPLDPDSDVARELRALVGNDLVDIIRARLDAEKQGDQPSQAA